jgi:hypothetical protein
MWTTAGTDSCLAPIQQFHWIDEGIQPDRLCRYTVATIVGTSAQPIMRDTCDLTVRTALIAGGGLAFVFNRGMTATPAYRTLFDTLPPSGRPPAQRAAAEAYLSCGLRESLLQFIGAAGAGDRLDIAIYELQDDKVVAALLAALDRGVVIRLIAHAKNDHARQANAPFLAQLRPQAGPGLTIGQRRRVPALSHNKVVLHSVQGTPQRVWCGSTNCTNQGFFRQTNVGITLDDPGLAQTYAAYLDLLATDPPAAPLRSAVGALVGAQPPNTSRRVFFAPSDRTDLLDATVDAIRAAHDVVLLSCAFGLDGRLSAALAALDPRVLIYGILNTNQREDVAVINRDARQESLFVLPTWIEQLNGQSYDASTGSGNQIHVKSLVVDPWGEHPTVLIGSANFSDESVFDNDENALLLRGDRHAAAVVATEFLRVFGHYRFRDRIRNLAQAYDTTPLPGQSGMLLGPEEDAPVWLVPPEEVASTPPGALVLGVTIDDLWLGETNTWQVPYLTEGHPKRRERAVFVGQS